VRSHRANPCEPSNRPHRPRSLGTEALGELRGGRGGVASGNGKGQILVKGQVIKTVPEHKIVETLIEESLRIAEEAGEQAEAGSPTVTVG
jgi:(E)-4-hydroxy-3-methylbut-2-enyl-diphosphate synthase